MRISENASKAHSEKSSGRPHVPIGPGESWGGQEYKRVMGASSRWLGRNIESINALNVFPVPDGDTGTNMALTMQAAVTQVAESPSHSVGELARAVSHGALMGARGNSGVILSQILRGFAESVGSKERINASDFADALVAATATAYRAVLKPVEGTILTVIKDSGEAAREAASRLNSFDYVLAETSKAARASVGRTPELLDKLREAGVVDAGGQGLWVLLDGMRRYAEGEEIEELMVESGNGYATVLEAAGGVHVEHGEYGYCTNFLLGGGEWDFDQVRDRMASMGDSAVIVGDDHLVKVHIHTKTPGRVLNYACSLGTLRQISITNMQDQHEEFLEMHAADGAGGASRTASAPQIADPLERATQEPVATSKIAVLAVASGAGLVRTFKSMGATAIIEGGQTMNPSTEDILRQVESVRQNEVLILPNNSNIIMSARQSASLTRKHVVVISTESIPQGMASLIAFNYEASLEENVKAMEQAARNVQTGELTRAIRDAKVEGIAVKAGEVIGLLNNTLVTKGKDLESVAWDLLQRMGASERELVTIYWGGDLKEREAQSFSGRVRKRLPNAEVELVNGGQPFYDYIISAE